MAYGQGPCRPARPTAEVRGRARLVPLAECQYFTLGRWDAARPFLTGAAGGLPGAGLGGRAGGHPPPGGRVPARAGGRVAPAGRDRPGPGGPGRAGGDPGVRPSRSDGRQPTARGIRSAIHPRHPFRRSAPDRPHTLPTPRYTYSPDGPVRGVGPMNYQLLTLGPGAYLGPGWPCWSGPGGRAAAGRSAGTTPRGSPWPSSSGRPSPGCGGPAGDDPCQPRHTRRPGRTGRRAAPSGGHVTRGRPDDSATGPARGPAIPARPASVRGTARVAAVPDGGYRRAGLLPCWKTL